MYPDLPPPAPLPREDDGSPRWQQVGRSVLARLGKLSVRARVGLAAAVVAALVLALYLLAQQLQGGAEDEEGSRPLPPAQTGPLLPAPPPLPGADTDEEAANPFPVDLNQLALAEAAAINGTPEIASVLVVESEKERLARLAPYVTARAAERLVRVPPVVAAEGETVTATVASADVIRADTRAVSFRVTLDLLRTLQGSAAPSTTDLADLRVEVILTADGSWRVDRITDAAGQSDPAAPAGD